MERVVGGKVTRRSFRRRAPPTPYDRPPIAERKRDGLVSRMFARAASSILPSVFSSSSHEKECRTSTSESLSNSSEEMSDTVSYHDANSPGTSAEKSQPCADPSIDNLISEKAKNDCDSGDIAEIELWLKERTFSSELANCLMDILRSSTSGLSHDDPHTSGFGAEAEGTMKLTMKPPECSILSEHWIKPKPQDTSLMKVVKGAGFSPAEIAKAYVKSLATESYPESRDGRLSLAKNSFVKGALASKMVYSSVPKPRICWPSPSLDSNHNYFTPKSSRVNAEENIFQLTPYSRSIFSSSKFNSGSGSQKTPNVPLPIWERSSTSGGIMVQEKYDGSAPKEFGNSHLATPSATNDVMKNSSSTLRLTSIKDPLARSLNSHIPEATENNVGSSSVHPKSKENARKILEHLNITIPPKESIVHLELEKTETRAVKSSSSNLRVPSDPSARSLKYHTATAEASASNIAFSSVHPNSNKDAQAAASPAVSKYLLPPSTQMRKQSKFGEKVSDEGFNFTFPMPAASNASSEPSTPTLNSPSPATGLGLPVGGGSGHVFSFGSNKAGHLISPVQQR